MVSRPSAPTANTTDFPETPKTLRGRFVNVNATPRSPIFSAFDQPWRAQGPQWLQLRQPQRLWTRRQRLPSLAAEPDHLPRLRSQGRKRQRDLRSDAVAQRRGFPQRHLPLHQLTGGSVDSGMAIYDTMKWISNDVATVAIGLAASMGQFLCVRARKASGTPFRIAGS